MLIPSYSQIILFDGVFLGVIQIINFFKVYQYKKFSIKHFIGCPLSFINQ